MSPRPSLSARVNPQALSRLGSNETVDADALPAGGADEGLVLEFDLDLSVIAADRVAGGAATPSPTAEVHELPSRQPMPRGDDVVMRELEAMGVSSALLTRVRRATG